MLDILKDFAMVDRREYLPYCPICGSTFLNSRAIYLLDCNHFFCANCVGYFGGQLGYTCPFDGQRSGVRDGGFLGEAVEFLEKWATLIGQLSKEEIVERLLAEILMVRKNLNFKEMPCRIGPNCLHNFLCPCDHTMSRYHTSLCPKQDCPNQDCMFDHQQIDMPQINSSAVHYTAVQPALEAQQIARPNGGHQATKPMRGMKNTERVEESQCCKLS